MKVKIEIIDNDFNLRNSKENSYIYAESKFYKQYYKQIDNMILHRLALINKIEFMDDLKQHVWEAIIYSLRKGMYKENGSLNNYIYGIVKNTVYKYSDQYTQVWNFQLDNQMIDDYSYKNYSDEVEINELKNFEIIKSLLNKLPKKRKNIFKLYYINELTYKQISEILNISESTVRGHIFSALKLIRSKLNILEE